MTYQSIAELTAYEDGYRNGKNDAVVEIFNEFDSWIKSEPREVYYWTDFQTQFRKIIDKAGVSI